MLPAPAGLASGFWVCSCVRVQGTAGGRAYQNAVPVGVYGPAISHGKPYYEGVNADAGRKYRLYLTSDQAERLTAWGHTCRAIWNVALEQRRFAWEQQRHTMRSAEQCAHLTQARADLDWLADLPAQCGQQILRRIDAAYDNWWNPGHPAGAPERKKRGARMSVPFPGQAVRVTRLNRKWGAVRLPKLGWARFRWSRALGGVIRNVTVTVDGNGRWHVSFGIALGSKPAPAKGLPGCGVDFGVACSAYVSDEDKPRLMPPTLTPGERKRLVGLQRRRARQVRFAKKHNGGRYSNRLRKTTRQIIELRARQARRRLDFTHQLTTDLAKNHGWIGIEDLSVKGMTRKPRQKPDPDQPGVFLPNGRRAKAGLNRSILDNAWGERRRQLAYKTTQLGSELRAVPAPGTSQTCSKCKFRDPQSRPGCGRLFACTACRHTEHADKNAAIEIEDRARRAGGPNSTRRHLAVPSPRGTGRRLREPLAGAA
jgi:putative transposase